MTDTEKTALERRIDELCAENERMRADQAHWELGNCPSCPNVVSLQEALEQNAKLRELCGRALVVIENNCSQCAYFYKCNIATDCKCVAPKKIRDEMRSLGIEVPA